MLKTLKAVAIFAVLSLAYIGAAFAQGAGGNVSITATGTSANVALPAASAQFQQMIIVPAAGSAAEAFYKLGTDNTVSAVANTDKAVPGGGVCVSRGPSTYLAAVTGGSSVTLRITMVAGCPIFSGASGLAAPGAAARLNALAVDSVGDSRMNDMKVSPTCGGLDWRYCGTNGQNFLVQAIAQGGYKMQFGINQASSGCRSDQYLYPTNFAPILNGSSKWVVFGYPFVNDLGAAGGSCAIQPGGGSFPLVNANGVTVDLSNVAQVGAGNITAAANQVIAQGKTVVISLEPGQTLTNNTAVTVGSGNAQISGNVLTVNSLTSGRFSVNQILNGTGITANATTIIGSALANSNLCSPACTGAGGAGTYATSGSSLSIGSETINGQYSTLAALYEANEYLIAYAASKTGQVYLYDPRPALWSATGSSTAVSYKTGMLLDGTTHAGWLGGYTGGAAFLSQIPAFNENIPDINVASINNVFPGNARQLINNPLFNGSATGGTLSTCTQSGGNATPPTGWQVACGASSTTVTMSVAADANGYGNAFTVVFTSTGADTTSIRNLSPNSSLVSLGSFYSGSALVSVANGSSNCTVDGEDQINSTTPANTLSSFALYGGSTASGGGSNVGPTTAYTIPLRTIPATYPSATTVAGFLSWRVNVRFAAAGTCTVTVSRAGLTRAKVYNPITNTFSGWLLMRDVFPASNDNSPLGLLKAG